MKQREPLRIAHISDLHFAAANLSPLHFFSKRWIGNFYQLLSRYKNFDCSQLEKLADQFSSLKIDYVLVTGDLTTTTRAQELELAKAFIARLQAKGLRVIAIPGNHDHYTKKAWREKHFYRFFPDHGENGFSLKEDGLALIPLQKEWTLLALDTACATPLRSSQGHFHPKTESALKKALSGIPSQQNIIVMNHFPLFEQERPRKTLVGASSLRSILSAYPNIRFYLHGHTHIHCVADLRASHYPIILDSGSTSQKASGTWNQIDLTPNSATVHAYRTASEPVQHSFQWTAP